MLTLACCCGHKSVVRSELSYLFAAICTEFTMYESVGNKVGLPNVFICQIFSFPFIVAPFQQKKRPLSIEEAEIRPQNTPTDDLQ